MHGRIWKWLGLFAFAASLLLWNLGGARTLSFHESLVAAGAKEMLARGDWLVPRIGGEPWLEKPPLPQWLVALSGALTGAVRGDLDGFGARLPAVLCGLLGVWLVADLVRAKCGRTLGILTGFVQASMVYFVTYARLAESDIFLWLITLGCFRILAARWVEPIEPPRWHNSRLMFFTLLGLTQLTKGPLFGAVLVLVPCGVFLALRRGEEDAASARRWLLYPPGVLLALAIGVAWPACILALYPEAGSLWLTHTVGRIHAPTTINPEPPWYYLGTIPWQILPWTLCVLPALGPSWRRAVRAAGGASSLDRLLWIWFLVPLGMLSLPSGKHHHYLIHALPPCAVWGARGLFACRRGLAWLTARPAAWLGVLAALGGAAGAAAPALTAYFGADIARELLGMAAVVLGWLGALALLARRARFRGFGLGLFTGVWLGCAYLHTHWLPWTDNYREETHLMRRFVERAPPGTPLAVMGMNPCRALFYTERPTHELPVLEDLHRLLDERGSCYLLTFAKWEPILEQVGNVTRLEVSAETAYNHWVRRGALGLYLMSKP
jgi:4-amino-4-deoxy-L-arabinose transferase-like glycosyltransferase